MTKVSPIATFANTAIRTMRKALLWSLLALVPFANLRMICFDHSGSTGVVRAVAAEGPDCSDFCRRDQAPPPNTESESGCVLVAGGCSVLTMMVVSLSAPPPALDAPAAGLLVLPRPQHLYRSPVLELFSPPPQL